MATNKLNRSKTARSSGKAKDTQGIYGINARKKRIEPTRATSDVTSKIKAIIIK